MIVRMLSMMVVEPKQKPKAKKPKEAAVPLWSPMRVKRSMEISRLELQRATEERIRLV